MAQDNRFPFRRAPVPLPADLEGGDQPFAPYPGNDVRGYDPNNPGALPPPYVPGSSSPGGSPYGEEWYQKKLRGKVIQIPFTAQVAAIQLRPEELERFYMFIVNFDAANRIFVGFDTIPNATNGVPLAANFGFYEPWIVPTNAILVVGSAANVTGMLIIAIEQKF